MASSPAERLAGWMFRRDLRVLAMHDVPDAPRFGVLLDDLARRYNIVHGAEAIAAASAPRRGQRRPAIWITFDDGHPSVFETALPMLEERGLSATAFVCPSVVGTKMPLWFQLVRGCGQEGLDWRCGGSVLGRDPDAVMAALKRMPDAERREACAELHSVAAQVGCRSVEHPQATVADLQRWVEAGCSVGNHTWDHPVLNRCDGAQITAQVSKAQDWLCQRGFEAKAFSYPDGAFDERTEHVLTAAGIQAAVGFDHATVDRSSSPLRISRLMLDADAPPARARAITSGWHSRLFGLAGRGAERRRMA